MVQEVCLLRDPEDADVDVATQAELWSNAFRELGFAIRHIDDDVITNGDADALARALDGCALAVVANICAVPAHGRVSAMASGVAVYARRGGGRVVFHHHELPWDPGAVSPTGAEVPPRIDGAVHVGVSLRARRDLQAHGYAGSIAIHDHFDFDAPTGDRATTRAALGFADDELVLHQPTAATRNTNVAGAVRFVTALHAAIPKQAMRYWLRGPIDDDVAPMVDRLFARCPVPFTVGGPPLGRRDAYAASDVVLLPSTWDPSGAAAVESTIARRPCVVGSFPVLGELQAIGLRFFDVTEPIELVKFLARPDERVLDVNLRRAGLSFSVVDLPGRIADALAIVGTTA